MTIEQKETLLYLLAQFKVNFYKATETAGAMLEYNTEYQDAGNIILRNLTSIEKQLKKL